MVVKTADFYMAGEFINRIRYLQKALNQAEEIINVLEQENNRLKDVLISLASENNEGYVLDSEAFNEPVCSV
jgi:hypothetical protein